MKAKEAKGIPDRKYYGSPFKDFNEGELIDFVIQKHLAERAGPHYDVRAGNKEKGLHSWVTKKELPEPGGQIGLIHQPVHSHKYKDFEGTIPAGYGAGEVKKVREGKLLVTKKDEDKSISFTTADNKPEKRYALIRTGKDDIYQWLLSRASHLSHQGVEKEKYKDIPSDKIYDYIKNLKDTDVVQPKVDGALAIIQFIKKHPEILSHRRSKNTGAPIVHTERVFGKRPKTDIPNEFDNSILLGELFGERKGKAIPIQELGGILNSTVVNSLKKQTDQNVNLKTLLFDVARKGNQKVDKNEVPYNDRRALLEQIIKYLPKDKFTLPEEARGPEAAKKLLKQISSGNHPLTTEGVVIHPEKGKPAKAKLTYEHDVYIRDVFPGEGKYRGVGAGGLRYSLTPTGPIVGKVGTGISDELRKLLMKNTADYIGRVARIKSQGQFEKTKAYRAPSLIAIHEDY